MPPRDQGEATIEGAERRRTRSSRLLRCGPEGEASGCHSSYSRMAREASGASRATNGNRPMTLTAKQRHALAVIAATGSDGATQTLLTAHGFSVRTIAALVKRGLVTIAREKVRTGGMWIDAAKVRITDARRDALAAGEAFGEG